MAAAARPRDGEPGLRGPAPAPPRGTGASGREDAATAAAARRGLLLTLEGIDGSGKSTLAQRLADRLEEAGVDVVRTAEPTGSWVGDAVRRAIRDDDADPFVDAFLFLADHADHVARIRTWLAEGKVVLSDRYGESCLAYQAATLDARFRAAGGDAFAWLRAAQGPVHRAPDLCLLLDLPAEVAVARIAARAEHAKFEEAAFLGRVRANYLRIADAAPWCEVLDATRTLEALEADAWARLQAHGIAPP